VFKDAVEQEILTHELDGVKIFEVVQDGNVVVTKLLYFASLQ
jgi:hypothetical protein